MPYPFLDLIGLEIEGIVHSRDDMRAFRTLVGGNNDRGFPRDSIFSQITRDIS